MYSSGVNSVVEAWSWYLWYLGGVKFVLLTLGYWSAYWTRTILWDTRTSMTGLTMNPKFVPDISSESVPFVPNRGDANKQRKIFSIRPFNLKGILATFSYVPSTWYKWDGFTGNVWYKLRFLSQPSNTRTNISKYASGPISWLIPKCKKYKLPPHQML